MLLVMQPRIREWDWALSCLRDGVDSKTAAWGLWGDVDPAGSGKQEQGTLLPWCFSAQSMCSVPGSSLAFPQECPCQTSTWSWKKSEGINRNWRKTRKRRNRKRRREGNTIATTPCTQRVRRTLPQLTTSTSSQRRCQRSVPVLGVWDLSVCSSWEIFAPTTAASLWCGSSRAGLS